MTIRNCSLPARAFSALLLALPRMVGWSDRVTTLLTVMGIGTVLTDPTPSRAVDHAAAFGRTRSPGM